MFVTTFSVAQVHRKVPKSQCTLTALHQYLVVQEVFAVHTFWGRQISYIYLFVCVYIYISPD